VGERDQDFHAESEDAVTCNPVHFAAATNVCRGNGLCIRGGDFNGDANRTWRDELSTNSVSILLGNGNGSFGAPANFPVAVLLPRSRSAISMAMATRTWRWPISARTPQGFIWEMTRAVSL